MARSGTNAGHKFSQIPKAEIQRSSFNRSHNIKTTFDSGFLIPILCDEALPGDTMSLKLSIFARMATALHPVMDNMWIDSFFFFVPNRLLWDNWQKFNGEQTDPGDSTDFLVPQIDLGPGGGVAHDLSDYIGIPPEIGGLDVSSLWHRAYNLIYSEWFRSQDLQDSPVLDRDDGPDDPADYPLRRRGKRHDYFTSCLPFPQKGPSVLLPLGQTAPVVGTGDLIPKWDVGSATDLSLFGDTANPLVRFSTGAATPPTTFNHATWRDTKLETDLSAATAATINEIRQAFQIQRLYERDARGGTRYTEILHAHFGVTSPDSRLQRPEYLGGGTVPINITPVPQTSETDTNTPQGTLTGYGIASSSNQGFVKSFVEHGVILGLVSVRADLNYAQGLHRQFSRRTRWDFFWPALAHLGEQTVLNKEIYVEGSSGGAADDQVFGYQERFAEYRYKPSNITGIFRPGYAGNLATWHLAQEYGPAPLLDDSFIQENAPFSRVVAITSEPEFLFDGFISLNHTRPMPTYSVPGMIDHF